MTRRIYSADHIAQGVRAVSQLRSKELEHNPPQSLSEFVNPMGAQQAGAQEEPPEQLEGHCVGCQTKRTFNVEERRPMPNGAILHSGKSDHPDCSHTVTTIVSKEKTRGAA